MSLHERVALARDRSVTTGTLLERLARLNDGSRLVAEDGPPFRKALTRTINTYAERNGLYKDDVKPEGKDFGEGLTAVVNVTLGMRSPEQVRRNVELHAQRVPDGLWDELRAQGLIRADLPAKRPTAAAPCRLHENPT